AAAATLIHSRASRRVGATGTRSAVASTHCDGRHVGADQSPRTIWTWTIPILDRTRVLGRRGCRTRPRCFKSCADANRRESVWDPTVAEHDTVSLLSLDKRSQRGE